MRTTETTKSEHTDATYSLVLLVIQLAKHLTTVIQPLTDKSRHKLQSNENFIDVIKTAQIPDDRRIVSFDLKSLFTSIPLQVALDCTETAITTSTVKLPLPTDDIMYLLNLYLTSTYFQYNDKPATNSYMEQLCARQFPLLLQRLLCRTSRNKPFRPTLRHYRYGRVALTTPLLPYMHKGEIDAFHEHLNRQNPHIQFTKEIEENGKIPFFRLLNKAATTTSYGLLFTENWATHTDKFLDQSFYNPNSHKATTIRTLTTVGERN